MAVFVRGLWRKVDRLKKMADCMHNLHTWF